MKDETLVDVVLDLDEKIVNFVNGDVGWKTTEMPVSPEPGNYNYFLWVGDNKKLYLTRGHTQEAKPVKWLEIFLPIDY